MADLIPLAQARCITRRGHEHRLGEARIRELLPQLPGWELLENGHVLGKTFRFPDYYRTMSFVNALAHIANAREPPSGPVGALRPLRGAFLHPRRRRAERERFHLRGESGSARRLKHRKALVAEATRT